VSFPRYLAAGCLVSVLIHGAGSAFFAQNSDEVRIAASKGGAVSVVGSIEELVAGVQLTAVEVTEPVDELEPVSEPLQPVQEPVQRAEVNDRVVADRVQPVTPRSDPVAAVAVTPVAPAKAVAPVAAAPVVAGITSTEKVAASKKVQSKSPAEPVPAQQVRPAEKPAQTTVAVPPALAKPLEPVERETDALTPVPDTLADITHAPTAKPKPPVKRAETPKPVRPEKAARPAPKGNAQANAKRGGERVTSQSARSTASGSANGKSNDRGSRAASNYKGRVAAKLRRAKRYPRQAERKQITGVVHVSFTIASSGSVSGIRISRSSGHAILDQAAIDMVTRASPMPKFPREVRHAKMTIQVPVQFD